MIAIDIVQLLEELESIADMRDRITEIDGQTVVNVDRMTRLTRELSESIPADIREARAIIRQKETVLDELKLDAWEATESAVQEAESIADAVRHESNGVATLNAVEEEEAPAIDESEIVKVAEIMAKLKSIA